MLGGIFNNWSCIILYFCYVGPWLGFLGNFYYHILLDILTSSFSKTIEKTYLPLEAFPPPFLSTFPSSTPHPFSLPSSPSPFFLHTLTSFFTFDVEVHFFFEFKSNKNVILLCNNTQ